MKATSLTIAAITDKGLERDHNEDYHLFNTDVASRNWSFFTTVPVPKLGKHGCLLVVADGMGGLNAGEVASETAVGSIRQSFDEMALQPDAMLKRDRDVILKEVTLKAHKQLVDHQIAHPETKGMGTTLVMAWITGNKATVCWVGDSRCSLYRPGKGLVQVSKDHSYVQELVDAGKISREMAFFHPNSNIITRNLGDSKRPAIADTVECGLVPGDRLLLYSDGVNSMLPDTDIEKIVAQEADTEACARQLVAEANRAGGHDNITAIVCDITDCEPSKLPFPADLWSDQSPTPKPRNRRWFVALVAIGVLVAAAVVSWFIINKEKGEGNPTDSTTLVEPDTSRRAAKMDTDGQSVTDDQRTTGQVNQPAATETAPLPVLITDTVLNAKKIKELKKIVGRLMQKEPKGITPKDYNQRLGNLHKQLGEAGTKNLKGAEANILLNSIQQFVNDHVSITDTSVKAELERLRTTAEPEIKTRTESQKEGKGTRR